MSKAFVRPLPSSEQINAAVNEAIDRLAAAHMALRAFCFMLNVTEELGDRVSGSYLTCLIQPHVAEVAAALDELIAVSIDSPTH